MVQAVREHPHGDRNLVIIFNYSNLLCSASCRAADQNDRLPYQGNTKFFKRINKFSWKRRAVGYEQRSRWVTKVSIIVVRFKQSKAGIKIMDSWIIHGVGPTDP